MVKESTKAKPRWNNMTHSSTSLGFHSVHKVRDFARGMGMLTWVFYFGRRMLDPVVMPIDLLSESSCTHCQESFCLVAYDRQ